MPESIRSDPVLVQRRRSGASLAEAVRHAYSRERVMMSWRIPTIATPVPWAECAEQRSWSPVVSASLHCCTLWVCLCRVQFCDNFSVLWSIYLFLMPGRNISAICMALVRDERYWVGWERLLLYRKQLPDDCSAWWDFKVSLAHSRILSAASNHLPYSVHSL